MNEQEKQTPADRPTGGKGPAKKEPAQEHSTPQAEVYYTMQSLVGVLVALVLVFTFVGRLILVDGDSMAPTLLDGEMMVVRAIGYTPERNDIVVLAKDGFHGGEAIVKRIIAVGGQTVDIDYGACTVYVDGVALEEDYIKEYMLQQPWQTTTSVTVPEGSVFVMGDNRNVSDDSRNESLGVVDERLVIGEAVLVLFPFNRFHAL